MASIAKAPDGRRRILFLNKSRDRKTIWLGRVSKHLAEEVKIRVERINNADISGCAVDGDTAASIGSIGEALHDKLVTVGLVASREPVPVPEPEPETPATTLGDFVESYVAGRTDTKERTRLNLRMFGNRLIAFFGADKAMDKVKRSDADAWIIDRIKYATGSGPLDSLLARAKAGPMPKEASGYEQPKLRLQVALCRELQREAGKGHWFLGCRTAAALLGIDDTTAYRWLFLLEQDGLLERVETGSKAARKASEWRYKR
jgi:hypothetical protein